MKKTNSKNLLFFLFLFFLFLLCSCNNDSRKRELYTISFQSNGGTQYSDVSAYKADSISLPVPKKECYTFSGWYDNETFSGDILGSSYIVVESKTLYAKWTAVGGTITYESNGGTQYEPTIVLGEYVNLPTPELMDYNFLGWYDNEQLSGDAIMGTYLPTTDVTLYAKWEYKYNTISFETNGGTAIETIPYRGEAINLPSTFKYGYVFLGWYDNEQLTGDEVLSPLEISNNIKLYAKYEKCTYLYLYYGKYLDSKRLEYKSGDEITVEQLNELFKPDDLVVTDFTGKEHNVPFLYWAFEGEDENSDTEVTSTINVGEEHVILVAKYDYSEVPAELYMTYDNENNSYTTTGKVAWEQTKAKSEYYSYSVNMTFIKGDSGAVGPAFRMLMPNTPYQYEGGCQYLCPGLNPSTGELQLSKVSDSWSRLEGNISLSSLPQAWQDKYNNTKANELITVVVTIKDCGKFFEVYIDSNLAYCYSNEEVLAEFSGKGLGVRSSTTPTILKDFNLNEVYKVEYNQKYGSSTTQYLLKNEEITFVGENSGILYDNPNDITTAYIYEFIGWSLTEGGELVTLITNNQTVYAVYEKCEVENPVTITFKVGSDVVKKLVVNSGDCLIEFPSISLPYTLTNGNVIFGSKYVWKVNDQEITSSTHFNENTVINASISDYVLTRNGVIITQDDDGNDVYTFFGNTATINQYGGRYGIGLQHLDTVNENSDSKASEFAFTVTVPEKPEMEIGVRTMLFINDNGNNVQVTGDTNSNQYFIAIHWNPHNGGFYITGKFNAGGKQLGTCSIDNISDCAYKNKYANWTSGSMSFDLKTVYGLDLNGDGWFKFYIDNCLIGAYGDNAIMTDGEINYGKTYGYDTITSASAIAIKNYAKADDVYIDKRGLGIGISMFQDTALCGGKMIYSKISNKLVNYYNISFDTMNDEVKVPSIKCTGSKQVILPNPTLDNKVFEGWYYDENLTQTVDSNNFNITSNIKLYAKWSNSFYKISFESNGGSTVDSISWINGELQLPTSPTKSPYVLEGWYYDKELTNVVDAATFNTTNNITLYAKWRFPYNYLTNNNDGTYSYNKKTTAVLGVVDKSIPESNYYNEYTLSSTFVKGAASVGIAFRMDITQDYSYETGTSYLSVQFAGGALRISQVYNGLWTRLVGDCSLSSLPQSWQDKYNSAEKDSKITASLLIKDYGTYFEAFIDGEIAYTYGQNGETADLSIQTGCGYGIRCSAATAVTFSNITVKSVEILSEN